MARMTGNRVLNVQQGRHWHKISWGEPQKLGTGILGLLRYQRSLRTLSIRPRWLITLSLTVGHEYEKAWF